MPGYIDALGAAYKAGYTYSQIAEYHAQQGWQAPPQADLAQLMHTPLGAAQYNTNVASQAYTKGTGPSDDELNAQPYNPLDAAAQSSPTNVEPSYQQPQQSDIKNNAIPGTSDTDATGELAPWEVQNPNGIGSYVPPPQDQDI